MKTPLLSPFLVSITLLAACGDGSSSSYTCACRVTTPDDATAEWLAANPPCAEQSCGDSPSGEVLFQGVWDEALHGASNPFGCDGTGSPTGGGVSTYEWEGVTYASCVWSCAEYLGDLHRVTLGGSEATGPLITSIGPAECE